MQTVSVGRARRGRPRRGRLVRALVAVVTGVALAACAAPHGGRSGAAAAGATRSAGPAASPQGQPTATASTTAPEPTPSTALGRRCGRPDVPARLLRLAGPGGNTLDAAEVGAGPTVAVFVHETGGAGLCGFWPYAVWLADRGVRSVLLDLCGYGESRCDLGARFAGDPVAQTGLAVTWARAHGAHRVTLVGASMGGTVATVAARPLHASAVVDLSGPVEFIGLDTAKAAPGLDMPTLMVAADNDPDTDAGRLRAALAAAPARHKRFVTVDAGHGWDTLAAGPFPEDGFSPVADVVRRWVLGDYRPS